LMIAKVRSIDTKESLQKLHGHAGQKPDLYKIRHFPKGSNREIARRTG